MRALNRMLFGFIAVSVLHRFLLLPHFVHLRVTDDEDVPFHHARAADVPLEFKLEPVFDVNEARAAMHRLICHGAQIDQKPKHVRGVELRHVHVRHYIFCLEKEAADLLPNVLAFNAVVVQHVGRAVQKSR